MATREVEQPNPETKPEAIWRILQETAALQKETDRRMKETDRRMKETDRIVKRTALQMEETDRRMAETDRRMAETDRIVKQTVRQVAETDHRFSSQWGSLMEALVEGDLIRLLQERGVNVHTVMTNYKTFAMGRQFELDLIAENEEVAVIVEVKTTLRVKDIRRFENTMRHIEEVVPRLARGQVLGAVAYLKEHESASVHAERRGFYVIRAVGSSSSIVNAEDFRPRNFGPKRFG